MGRFHFVNNVKLHEKIIYLMGELECKNLSSLVNVLFTDSKSSENLLMDYLQCINLDLIQLSVLSECKKDVYVSISDNVHIAIKHLHSNMDIYSMALIFRSVLKEAVEFIENYGLENWYFYVKSIIGLYEEVSNNDQIEDDNVIEEIKTHIISAHKCIYKEKQISRIEFFNFSSEYLGYYLL